MERAKTSGRVDDTEEVIRRRLQVYAEESRPVVELYRQFGRVREVDGGKDVSDVWADTRKAMLPQVSFMIGPHASGKSTLGKALCERSNSVQLNFNQFLVS
jgi:adenylate kinase family enzyme